jgi:hypothetical protein
LQAYYYQIGKIDELGFFQEHPAKKKKIIFFLKKSFGGKKIKFFLKKKKKLWGCHSTPKA